MTAEDIITDAMYKCNAIALPQTPTAAEGALGLANLNDMMDAWQTEKLLVPFMQRQVFPLLPPKQTYTMGLGGDFNVPRPTRIERMGIITMNNPAQPLETPLEYLTEAQWALIPVKQVASAMPQRCWDDQAFPFRNLNFWCIPSANLAVAIYNWAALTTFPDLSTDYIFPPGYSDAIKWNLAFRLACHFGPYVPPTLAPMAAEAKGRIKSVNDRVIYLRVDEALVGTGKRQYNWMSDSPVGSR